MNSVYHLEEDVCAFVGYNDDDGGDDGTVVEFLTSVGPTVGRIHKVRSQMTVSQMCIA